MLRFLLFACLLSGTAPALWAQQPENTTTTRVHQDPATGIRVTTKTTPLAPPAPQPTPQEQLRDLEALLEQARQNPQFVADGTVRKYELAVEEKRRQVQAARDER